MRHTFRGSMNSDAIANIFMAVAVPYYIAYACVDNRPNNVHQQARWLWTPRRPRARLKQHRRVNYAKSLVARSYYSTLCQAKDTRPRLYAIYAYVYKPARQRKHKYKHTHRKSDRKYTYPPYGRWSLWRRDSITPPFFTQVILLLYYIWRQSERCGTRMQLCGGSSNFVVWLHNIVFSKSILRLSGDTSPEFTLDDVLTMCCDNYVSIINPTAKCVPSVFCVVLARSCVFCAVSGVNVGCDCWDDWQRICSFVWRTFAPD